PLVGSPLNLAQQGTHYFENTLDLAADLSYLRQHQVFGMPVLPAVGFLEMAIAASHLDSTLAPSKSYPPLPLPGGEKNISAHNTSLPLLRGVPEGRGVLKDGLRPGCVLHSVAIQQALCLDDQSRTIQVVLQPSASSSAEFTRFEIFSQVADQPWVCHASGQIGAVQSESSESLKSLDTLKTQCPQAVAAADCYQRLADQQVTYGESFQAIQQLWRGENQVLSQLRLPDPLTTTAAHYQLHPVLWDACLQSIAALFIDHSETQTYLPAYLDQLSVLSNLAALQPLTEIWSHVQIEVGINHATATIQVFTVGGEPIALLTGLQLRPASADRLFQADRTSDKSLPIWTDWLYTIDWRSQPLENLKPLNEILLAPGVIRDRTAAQLAQRLQEPDAVAYQANQLKLEQLGLAYITDAIQDLAGGVSLPSTFSTEGIATQWQVLEQYQPLLERCFKLLAEAQIVESTAEGWQCLQQFNASERRAPLVELGTQADQVQTELTLLGRCGQNLAAVLKGEVDPLTLLFPNGDRTILTQLYQSSVGATVMNGLLLQALTIGLENYFADPDSAQANQRRLRILEIGAGTGGTTAHVLPALESLPPSTVEYTFTDISPYFLAQAEAQFQAYTNVRYQVLDIERSPLEQGFTAAQYDLVIAANVLHATANLPQTLAHVQQLLAPSGQLFLLESTQALCWLDLTFGLTTGWWKFQDQDLRPDHPLISSAQWQQLLESQGWTAAVLEPQEGCDVTLAQSVIVAQAPTQVAETWLIFGDASMLTQSLIEQAGDRGIESILVTAGDRYAAQTDNSFCLNPQQPGDVQQLFTTLLEQQRQPQRVLYLWGSSHLNSLSLGDFRNSGSLKAQLQHTCSGLLHLVQVLSTLSAPPKLLLVTQGAIAVEAPDVVLSQEIQAEQAPIWGLGRVIALEYPALNCCRIDLDPRAGLDQQVSTLMAELIAPNLAAGMAEAIAYRQQQRWVARLGQPESSLSLEQPPKSPDSLREGSAKTPVYVPAPIDGELPKFSLAKGSGVLEGGSFYQLAIQAKGTLENLHWRVETRRNLQPTEVEIAVEATGLNLIDVLDTLNLLPFERDNLGVECAGTVVAIGSEVTGLAVGDRVLALAPACFSQFVTIDQALVAEYPDTLNAIEAASIPANFLTAYYALQTIAQLQPWEPTSNQPRPRVLIHAAAGGTGMAAVQIAQKLGAEVFATASPPKWDALRAIGVQHVLHSRTLAFADTILELTQGEGVDLVLNSLAGEFIPKSLAVLKPTGHFLEIGKRDTWTAEQVATLQPGVTYTRLDLMTVAREQPQTIQTLLQALRHQFATGELQPSPQRVFPVAQAIAAFRYMQQAKQIGKIVLDWRQPDLSEKTYLV
ncbi:MAG: polyketide synthase dehydratase domain-containing protein, partial [Cyanobacteria bacterium P01_H01_bin.121]